MSGKQQFNVYLQPELIKTVKRAAIDAHDVGMSLSDFVEDALKVYLGLLEKDDATELITKYRKDDV